MLINMRINPIKETDMGTIKIAKSYSQPNVSNIPIESINLINEPKIEEINISNNIEEKNLSVQDVDLSDYWKNKLKDDSKLKITEYYTDGKISSKKITNEWGVLLEKIEYEDSAMLSRTVYSDDNPISIAYYYSNGKIQSFTELFAYDFIGYNKNPKQTTYYNEDGKISSIDFFDIDGHIGCHEIYDNNGNIIKQILYTDDNIVAKEIHYDSNGNIIKEIYSNEIDCTCGGNGGSQMSFRETENLLNDQKILDILKNYYPDASYEDYEQYLTKISKTGCGYTALVNTIFSSFQGREQEFEQTFGFPMYDVDYDSEKHTTQINTNYNYLILDFFSWKRKTNNIGIATFFANGMNDLDENEFEDYMKDRFNVSVNVTNTQKNIFGNMAEAFSLLLPQSWRKVTKDNFLDVYKSLKTDNNYIILGSNGYNLFDPENFGDRTNIFDPENFDDRFDDGVNLNAVVDGGSHAMLITGISERGNLLVSSWGRTYEVDFSDIGFMDYIDYTVIEYN